MRRAAAGVVRPVVSTFAQALRSTSTVAASPTPGKVRVTFVEPSGRRVETLSKIGTTLMESARDDAKVDIEAACDGTCACSTCHVYIEDKFLKFCGEASEDELDMLDLALGLQPNSRLSCQIKLDAPMDGMVVTLPKETSNQLS